MYSAVKPIHTFHFPFLYEDMVVILEDCLIEPFSLRKNDTLLFAKKEKELIDKICSLDGHIKSEMDINPTSRVYNAINLLLRLLFLEAESQKRQILYYKITKPGKEWLDCTHPQRLQFILERIRNETLGNEYEYDDGIHLGILQNIFRFNFLILSFLIHQYLSDAFTSVPFDSFIYVDDFYNDQSQKVNPLKDSNNHFNFLYRTRETKNNIWVTIINNYLFNWLIPIGGCQIGWTEHNKLVFTMTDTGMYIFGKNDTFSQHKIESKPVVVQPTFDIFFTEPSLYAETILTRYAERTGNHIGNVFHLTSASVKRAAIAGIPLETIIDDLTKISAKPLPENVIHELNEWHGKARCVSIEAALIIECPDLETSALVKKAGGKSIHLVNDTTLICSNIKQKQTLINKLKKLGVFIKQNIE